MSSPRSGRMFSNPLGVFGHAPCTVQTDGLNATGRCFNEIECLGSGGLIQGYCSPAALGVCCVFSSNKCGQEVRQPVSYFTNPSYPSKDTRPIACLLKVLPPKDVCYVQFDFESFEVASSANGKCGYDSLHILRSPSGPGGSMCGDKTGYATLTRVNPGEEVGLIAVVQTAGYRWKIRITMIHCTEVGDVPRIADCGQTGSILDNRLRKDMGTNVKLKRRKRIKLKKKVRRYRREVSKSLNSTNSSSSLLSRQRRDEFGMHLCQRQDYKEVCAIVQQQKQNRQSVESASGRAGDDIPRPSVSQLYKKRFTRSEVFQPAFSVRQTFCESKFSKIQPKIYNGQDAPVNVFPWIVSLQFDGTHFCGGTLIDTQWVLTTAHCPDFPHVPNFLSKLSVSLGDHELYTSRDTASILRNVTKVINYPLYDQAGYNGDLALLKLSQPVPFSRTLRPVCLPRDSVDTYERQVGVTAGWGRTERGDMPTILKYVELNIVPNITCVANLGVVDIAITDKMLCTFKGPTGRETTCTGDSGGPLMVRRSGRYILVGTTSFSVVDCESPFPNVFSRVSAFMDWIAVAVLDRGSV